MAKNIIAILIVFVGIGVGVFVMFFSSNQASKQAGFDEPKKVETSELERAGWDEGEKLIERKQHAMVFGESVDITTAAGQISPSGRFLYRPTCAGPEGPCWEVIEDRENKLVFRFSDWERGVHGFQNGTWVGDLYFLGIRGNGLYVVLPSTLPVQDVVIDKELIENYKVFDDLDTLIDSKWFVDLKMEEDQVFFTSLTRSTGDEERYEYKISSRELKKLSN